jgi:hypothetical protein
MTKEITPEDSPRRFPRFPSGKHTAALMKLVWTEPSFAATVSGRGIKFKFRVSMSDDLLQTEASVASRLFTNDPGAWEKAISAAYNEAKYGQKSARELISAVLRVVTANAFRIWLGETWSLVQNLSMEAELKIFGQNSVVKRGPQPDAGLALLAAIGFEKQLPAVKAAQKELRKRCSQPKEKDLAKELGSRFSIDDFRYALDDVCKTRSAKLSRFLEPGISPTAIAERLVERNLKISDFTVGRVSLAKHIRYGNELLAALVGPT